LAIDGTIRGGALGTLDLAPSLYTLDGVTIGSDLIIPTSTVTVLNGLTLSGGATLTLRQRGLAQAALNFRDGEQTLGGDGRVVFETEFAAVGFNSLRPMATGADPVVLTIGAGVAISTGPGAGGAVGGADQPNASIVNRGTIAVRNPSQVLQILDTFTNAGSVRAGVGTTIQLSGTFVQTGAGSLTFEVGGVPESGRFGQIVADNPVTLDGVANIVSTVGFRPTAGAEYSLIQFPSRTGSFATVNGLSTGGVQLFTADLRDQAFVLIATGNAVPGLFPSVTDVFVSGGQWVGTFLEALASVGLGDLTLGRRLDAGRDALLNLPWTNLDRVSLRFDRAVNVESSDLVVGGVRTPTYAIASFTYDDVTHTATWTLADPLAADRLLLDLDAEGVTAVQGGQALDGDYAGDFPSGDGIEGGDFRYRFNVLPGDITRNGQVNVVDLGQTRRRTPGHHRPLPYDVLSDVNGDGAIDTQDQGLVTARLLDQLPAVRVDPYRPATARTRAGLQALLDDPREDPAGPRPA
jgi:hypothetical protein